jgi:restriction endonuclease Mrr
MAKDRLDVVYDESTISIYCNRVEIETYDYDGYKSTAEISYDAILKIHDIMTSVEAEDGRAALEEERRQKELKRKKAAATNKANTKKKKAKAQKKKQVLAEAQELLSDEQLSILGLKVD